ncbi:MAG: hydrogenase iron-sulfur subunit [Gammaproteobacteria bacterium]|nr:hydrogenase iron-sulfur subunit [Gammaproteobacteria bacterium]MDH5302764.1 hydrogenase iron-sulfur subunit [Gammaproteobacteria bacterium]MDH5321304.1 hydrogenase iron-sulfur subunit [Gammaproteobacteria bacterium]
MKRALRTIFARAEALLEWGFGQRLNPLSCLGALGWYFFWIVAGSGIYLYIFFDTGITNAHASIEAMTHEQWYAAGIMRSLHRYASDALVVVALLHLLREYSLDRLRGKRFFAWLTGVPLLWFIYVCGITGYWLVWDKLAQMIAVATTEWLDTLPFFGEPIANNFLNSSTLSDRFFTLMVFMHIFAPLFMLFLMWLHIQRHAQARVNPPRELAIGTAVMLLLLSLAYPAVSQAPADLDVVPANVALDWYYLGVYPLLEVIPGGQLWLLLFGVTAVLAVLPWVPPAKIAPAAVVNLENCNGCGRCFQDCPFSAITMLPRSDGMAYAVEAVVNTDNCVSCGICVGACPTATPFRRATAIVAGIELPEFSIAGLRAQTMAANAGEPGTPRVLVYACEHSEAESLRAPGTSVITMPCVAMLPPAFIDFALSRGHADGVMLAGCAQGDCHYRLGDVWTQQRIDGARDPYLRQRVARERLAISWLAGKPKRRQQVLDEFRSRLRSLPPRSKTRQSDRA